MIIRLSNFYRKPAIKYEMIMIWLATMSTFTFLNKRLLVWGFLSLFSALTPIEANAADSAVVIMYHRFGESRYPSTNTTVKQLTEHIQELKDGDYNIRPVPEILAAIQAGRTLPDKTIGITIDDAFLSVYKTGWPLLRRAKFPFTLFVATEPLDRRNTGYMSWDHLRELQKAGVTIASQTETHLHMPYATDKKNFSDLTNSNSRFKKELGFIPKMIAYPYGEYSLAVGKVALKAGFNIGFGQHSGVIYKNSNFMYLPRFSFNEAFGNIKRFRLAINALPLKVKDQTPSDPYLKNYQNPPTLGFTVVEHDIKQLSRIACYATRQGRLEVTILGERRIEVRAPKLFTLGRTRVNCTMPKQNGRWHWLGTQYLVSN